MRNVFYLVLCGCVVWGFAGEAQAYSGFDLLSHCYSYQIQLEDSTGNAKQDLPMTKSAGRCLGYLEAVKNMETSCLPNEVGARQAVKVVVDHIQSLIFDREIDSNALPLVQAAFVDAFPCPEGN